MSGFLTGLVLRGAGARAAVPRRRARRSRPRSACRRPPRTCGARHSRTLLPRIPLSQRRRHSRNPTPPCTQAPSRRTRCPSRGSLPQSRVNPVQPVTPDAVPPRPANAEAPPAPSVSPRSFELETHLEAPSPPAPTDRRPSQAPPRPPARRRRQPAATTARQSARRRCRATPRSTESPSTGQASASLATPPSSSERPTVPGLQPRADHAAEPAPAPISRPGPSDQPAAPPVTHPAPSRARVVEAQAMVPAQRPEPGRVVAPPDQASHAPRIEVHIGRVEVRIVPPPRRPRTPQRPPATPAPPTITPWRAGTSTGAGTEAAPWPVSTRFPGSAGRCGGCCWIA